MDKDILKYLDKVGQYVQGTSEKGFEVYVHGVFIESVTYTVIGLIMIILAAITIKIIFKKVDYTNDAYWYSTLPALVAFIGFMFIVISATGIFAPDYVAIKQIIDGIGGK